MRDHTFEVQDVAADQLPEVEQDWAQLAEHAAEPNPFYEPWMLPPALTATKAGNDVRAALVWQTNPGNAEEKRLLVGFFPYTVERSYKMLPISVSQMLSHLYCFCGTPLLHKVHTRQALDAYFHWLNGPGAPTKIVHFQQLFTGGAFHRTLVDVIHSRSLFSLVERRYLRAMFKRPTNASEVFAVQMSVRALKRLERQKDLLKELGTLEVRHLDSADELTSWTDAFLDLEASGWKGRAGTALASQASHAEFFRQITRAAHERGRLIMSGLWLNGKAIAARTAFRAGEGSFLFKIAYDAAFARYSPGTLLEMENILLANRGPDRWEDSCAAAGDLASRQLSRHSRPVEDLAVSAGSLYGDFLLSVVPLLAFVKTHLLRRKSRVKSAQPEKSQSGSPQGAGWTPTGSLAPLHDRR